MCDYDIHRLSNGVANKSQVESGLLDDTHNANHAFAIIFFSFPILVQTSTLTFLTWRVSTIRLLLATKEKKMVWNSFTMGISCRRRNDTKKHFQYTGRRMEKEKSGKKLQREKYGTHRECNMKRARERSNAASHVDWKIATAAAAAAAACKDSKCSLQWIYFIHSDISRCLCERASETDLRCPYCRSQHWRRLQCERAHWYVYLLLVFTFPRWTRSDATSPSQHIACCQYGFVLRKCCMCAIESHSNCLEFVNHFIFSESVKIRTHKKLKSSIEDAWIATLHFNRNKSFTKLNTAINNSSNHRH